MRGNVQVRSLRGAGRSNASGLPGDGRALRIETVVNSPDDLQCHRRLQHLDQLQTNARAVNSRLLDTEPKSTA